jgi:hypothetical protein
MKVVSALSILFSVVNANIVLYHRIFHPSFQNSKYLERGSISGDPPTFKSSDSLVHDIQTLITTLKDLDNVSDALYQVAMTSKNLDSLSNSDYSSVKACHLQQANAQTWIIYATGDDIPFSLDYFVSPVPNDGTCPEGMVVSAALVDSIQNMNTTITFNRPAIPPQPELRAPPPLTAEGEAVQPPPQKSFIQKYWLYIVGFLLIMVVASPEEPEKPRSSGQSSS